MKIIGFIGNKCSGKTEAANILRRLHLPNQSAHVNFADKIKEIVCNAFHISLNELEKHKQYYRLILQGIGTDLGRNLWGKGHWIKEWLIRVNKLPKETSLVVVSDVRFLNEADVIKRLGGKLVLIRRKINSAAEDLHQSETEFKNIVPDFVINNDSNLDHLRLVIKNLYKDLLL